MLKIPVTDDRFQSVLDPVFKGTKIENKNVKKAADGDEELDPAKIAIQNADQLRSLINRYTTETINRGGQWRELYFDAEGRLKTINGPDIGKIWIDKELSDDDLLRTHLRVSVNLQKLIWNPDQGPALTQTFGNISIP